MKIHFVNVNCAAKGNAARCTSDPSKVTCTLCLQFVEAHNIRSLNPARPTGSDS